MDKADPVTMDSSTYRLPINSRLGYRETIKHATRISTDGICLHQLEATVWAHRNTNVSHVRSCSHRHPWGNVPGGETTVGADREIRRGQQI